jgi:hypothetical protein
MATKNFKPEKSFKDVGSASAAFNSAVNAALAKDATSKSATADAWAKHVNQIDWESPVAKTDNPNDDNT